MLITVCLPPPLISTERKETVLPKCRAFSDLEHFQSWLEENNIQMACPVDWRWP